ncbi:hypothetical protein M885DRAFT_553148 [Pelagophyceae sp. CCMP2097]|nr:hypothetical protein M885DRAFT_553148 [Pelagophyceae sp. CCMP2097]|mmetsp:Transcript_16733/g.56534  ORF Transcript_16733/g.56534 Transcript_16733/m.56534 type:complete len:172 (+) Transcript_16733:56-571(+)
MRSFVLLAAAATAGAADVACPGSPSWVHAKATVTAKFPTASCADVKAEMLARIHGEGGWVDPHNGGTYVVTADEAGVLSTSRTTKNKQYTDKQTTTFAGTAQGCTLQMCSESQVMSIADFSTNYCNLHVLFCGSKDGCPVAAADLDYTETSTKSAGASNDASACIAAPVNA